MTLMHPVCLFSHYACKCKGEKKKKHISNSPNTSSITSSVVLSIPALKLGLFTLVIIVCSCWSKYANLIFLRQLFWNLNFNVHWNKTESFLKCKFPFYVWDGTWDSAFLTGSQGLPLPLIPRPVHTLGSRVLELVILLGLFHLFSG